MKGVSKERKEKIMEMIEKAGNPENYETSWDEKGALKSFRATPEGNRFYRKEDLNLS